MVLMVGKHLGGLSNIRESQELGWGVRAQAAGLVRAFGRCGGGTKPCQCGASGGAAERARSATTAFLAQEMDMIFCLSLGGTPC